MGFSRKLILATFLFAVLSVPMIANATLVGSTIEAELYEVGGSIIQVRTQFTSPALIVDPGVEFSGFLYFGTACQTCFGGVEIDFDDTGFTVSGNGNMYHNGSQFGIRIFNIPDNIINVVEFSGVGFEAELNIESGFVIDLRYSGWSSGSVDRYGFEFSPTPLPVPAPSAVWLFGSGLIGLIGITKCKTT